MCNDVNVFTSLMMMISYNHRTKGMTYDYVDIIKTLGQFGKCICCIYDHL